VTYPLPAFEVWHPILRPVDASAAVLDLHLIAARDSMAFDTGDDGLVRLCLAACGLKDVSLHEWSLSEFVSPYYGEDQYSESWDERVGRAWSVVATVSPPPGPVSFPKRVEIDGSIRDGDGMRPLDKLPVLAIANGRDPQAVAAARHALPDAAGATVLPFEGYHQLRVDVDSYPADTLNALDDLIELCDEHQLSTHWREFLTEWG
jgi:hypothetical protein